ncbi:response regulator [bacterium]|nr:response regulator [bacterium]
MIFRKVLVVHESAVVRNLIHGYLLAESSDIQFIEAKSGQDAERLLNSEKLDVILCARYLRNIDSVQLNARKRATDLNVNTPFVVFTSTNTNEHIEELKNYGIDQYLISPFSTMELRDKIDEVCNPKSLRKQTRFSVPDAKIIVHLEQRDVEATVINLSLGSILCEVELPSICYELFDSTYVSMQFSEEYDNVLVTDILCKFLSIKAIEWNLENIPSKVQIVWLFSELSRNNETLYRGVLDSIEKKHKKLFTLDF